MTAKMLKHMGYCGSIEFSIEDNCSHGRLLFIRDLVTYEADRPESLVLAFEQAVENYLEQCVRTGLAPDKPAAE